MRYIMRPLSDSSKSLPEPGCCTQRPRFCVGQRLVNAATGIRVGPVKVELVGVVKSTWNLYKLMLALPSGSSSATKFGVPAAGGVGPSKSEGCIAKSLELRWKH